MLAQIKTGSSGDRAQDPFVLQHKLSLHVITTA